MKTPGIPALMALLLIACGDSATTPDPSPPLPPMVSPSQLVFERIGDTAQLTASGEDASGHAIAGDEIAATWSSVDASVARVDSTGLVTAIGNGSTAVMAAWGVLRGYGCEHCR